MENNKRVYVENEFVVFEKKLQWQDIVTLANEEGIPTNKMSIGSVITLLMSYLTENFDVTELFCEYLESVSEEK
jgi:hypothetical protein